VCIAFPARSNSATRCRNRSHSAHVALLRLVARLQPGAWPLPQLHWLHV
jgi:hypothetical protein